MERHILTGDTDVAAPNSSVSNQPPGDQPCGVAPDGKADALRWANHCRIHADHFACRVDERSAGIARIKCRVGLNDVVDQTTRLRIHRATERTDHARCYAGLETKWISNRDRELANLQALGAGQTHVR